MKKIIFILMIFVSIVFVSCVPTEIKTISTSGIELSVTAEDFFNPVEFVRSDYYRATIVMDKNTGVLYVWKHTGYHWGMSPVYDSDGSVLTKEKWLARQVERRKNNE